MVQAKISPVWIIWCDIRLLEEEKVLSHSEQEKGFYPEWFLLWIFRVFEEEGYIRLFHISLFLATRK